jgi:PHP family Zn ribbon phosphoesterase
MFHNFCERKFYLIMGDNIFDVDDEGDALVKKTVSYIVGEKNLDEAYAAPHAVKLTACKYGIQGNQTWKWRKCSQKITRGVSYSLQSIAWIQEAQQGAKPDHVTITNWASNSWNQVGADTITNIWNSLQLYLLMNNCTSCEVKHD